MGIPFLRVEDLTVAYDGPQPCAPALDHVCLTLEPGESIGILGESGSGKSTLALAIPRLLGKRAIQSGRVTFRGRDLTAMRERDLARMRGREIAMVFQQPAAALNPFLTIAAQIAEVARMHVSNSRREAMIAARGALEIAFGDDAACVGESYPHELSGGQQQRACIAQAVVARPALIIADEPTASLDGVSQRGILDLFQKLRRDSGTSLVFITHHPAVLPGLVDRVAVLASGRVVEDGSLAGVYCRPQREQTARLLRAARGTGEAATRAVANDDGRPVLQARGVTKIYDREGGGWFGRRRVLAVEDVDFDLRKGQSVALVGASGSGKSTLARCLAGIEPPTSGSVSNPANAATQLVAQDAAGSLNPRFTAEQAIDEPLVIARWRDRLSRRREAQRLMNATGLPTDAIGRRTSNFSGGQKQRLAVARALAAQPQIIIWDESFSALDLPLQSEILELLEATRRERSLTYVFIAHDLTLAARACDEIAVMSHGRVVERKATADLLAAPQHPCARALVDAIPRMLADLEEKA